MPDDRTIAEIYADIGSVQEVADALGVSKCHIYRWIERRRTTHAPESVRRLSTGRLYSISEWRAWLALWRMTGGTRGSENFRNFNRRSRVDS